MNVPIAHFGHWSIYVLYGLPVVIVLAAAAREGWRSWRQRGSGRAGGEDEKGSADQA